MLKLNTPVTTPHGLSLTGVVYRWTGLQLDARGSAVVVLTGYASLEAAQAYGTPAEKQPIEERRYGVGGLDFARLAAGAPVGANHSEVISSMIYSHIRAAVPEFAGAEDVGL